MEDISPSLQEQKWDLWRLEEGGINLVVNLCQENFPTEHVIFTRDSSSSIKITKIHKK